jgi:hypothetical protein
MSQTAISLNSGDHVRIVDAQPGTPDAKALVYYDYYRNLTGTVVKAYDDGTVAISVDRDSLPAEIRTRHEDSERMQRDRWLNNLSDEDRNRLTEKEKSFSLRYTVLVATKHVVPEKPGAHAAAPAPEDTPASRKTLADLEAAEAAYLKSKKS